MNNKDLEMIDISDSINKKDTFIKIIYIALIILIILGSITYFFGYDILKPYIKV